MNLISILKDFDNVVNTNFKNKISYNKIIKNVQDKEVNEIKKKDQLLLSLLITQYIENFKIN